MDDLSNEIFKVKIIDITGDPEDPYGLSDYHGSYKDLSEGLDLVLADLSKIATNVETIANAGEPEAQPDTTEQGADETNQTPSSKKYYVYGTKGEYIGEVSAANESEAQKKAEELTDDPGFTIKNEKLPDRGASEASQTPFLENIATAISDIATSVVDGFKSMFGFSEGGLVDYTGIAAVHGSKAHPESFLDAADTALLRSMLDAYSKISYIPSAPNIDSSMFKGDTNVGDINITINQAELQSDADYDKVARRVGQAFVKEMNKNGLNLSGYAV